MKRKGDSASLTPQSVDLTVVQTDSLDAGASATVTIVVTVDRLN